jgi:hypothetical protein
MKKTVILLLCILAFTARGQKIRYGGMQQFGLTIGRHGVNTGFSMVNGIRFKRFFTGIGADIQFRNNTVSYESYNPYNNSALFADVRYYINKKKNFFAKVVGGVNLIINDLGYSSYEKYDKQAGLYAGAGLGFKARIGKEVFYTFDVSYSVRQTRFVHHYNYFGIYGWQTEKYDLRRFTIQVNMGIEIF